MLEKKKAYIEKLRSDFDAKRTMKHFAYIKRKFPLFNDYNNELRKFDDYPNLVLCILIAKIMEKKMPFFYKRLKKRVKYLDCQIDGKETKEVKTAYDFLMAGGRRGISEKKLRKQLKQVIKNIDSEITEYENESDIYEKRDIKRFGLLTNDTVKCLKDFNGKTFPFLRAICLQVKQKDTFLELRIGTGILSIAAVVAGAKKSVGIELNPITCLLAKDIVTYLEERKVIPKKTVEILWGNALNFATKEYKEYKDTTFDVLLSENIYTGMFFELQMKMISHVIRNNILKSEKGIVDGFLTRITKAHVIPKGMSSSAELVELSQNIDKPTEVLIDLKKKGIGMKKMSMYRVYDQIRFNVDDEPEIVSVMKFKILKDGLINALNLFSSICIMDGDYVNRNETKFFCNDSVLGLNKPINVKEGDVIIVGLAFNESDKIKNIILELRKLNEYGTVNKKYDARLNISEEEHMKNITHFLKKNKCRTPINLSRLGDYESIRSSSFDRGYERIWLSNIDYSV